jgi:hypothetical protein
VISDEFIRTVVAQIQGNDEVYEQSLLEREKANQRYAFFVQGVNNSSASKLCAADARSIAPQTSLLSLSPRQVPGTRA